MNWVNTIKSTIKNFTWELSHTLINYLFGLSIKKELKINPNCYIFLKTKNNRLITSTNYVKYSDKDYFNYLECKKVNAHINRSLIPTMFERISARITDYISESVGGFDAEVASLLGGLQLPEEAHARPDAEKRASRSAPRRRGAAR